LTASVPELERRAGGRRDVKEGEEKQMKRSFLSRLRVSGSGPGIAAASRIIHESKQDGGNTRLNKLKLITPI